MLEVTRWMVFRKIDAEPVEVFPFPDKEKAEDFYERMSAAWTETYLVKVVHGPGPEWREQPSGDDDD